MHSIEEKITVDVPIRTAYNQWTQFEDFPRFMEGVKSVRQLDDKRLEWHAEIAGKDVEWTAEIVEQTPDKRISWNSTSGRAQMGTVSFSPVDADRTEITLRIEFDAEGATENAGAALGFVKARVKGDLKRFKEFIEERGVETGQWRGEIHGGQVRGQQQQPPRR
jgi:uncharacterized membrane protein